MCPPRRGIAQILADLIPRFLVGAVIGVHVGPALAGDAGSAVKAARGEIPRRVFWGDTHVHTDNSLDAGLFGCRLGPEETFRFARGEEVLSSTGVRAKLDRPYDFLA